MDAFPEDWQRAVAVVAHPDDFEYGLAGAVAWWTAQDKTVAYVLATSGEAGIGGIAPDRCGPCVDVTDSLAQGIASLEEHRAYIDGLSSDFDPATFLTDSAAAAGTAAGCDHAVLLPRFPV